jgi:hypothetical protein
MNCRVNLHCIAIDNDHGAVGTSERERGAEGMSFLACASLHLIVPTALAVSEVGRCGVAVVARRQAPPRLRIPTQAPGLSGPAGHDLTRVLPLI